MGRLSLKNSELDKLKKLYSRPRNQMSSALGKTFVLENSPAWLVMALLRRFVIKSDYNAKRESRNFFERANVAYGAHKQRRSARLLRVAFGMLGDEFPRSYTRLIIDATNQTQRDASRRGSLSSEILDATKDLTIDITDATGWYQLSRGLFSVGYFRAAWVARENSLELSIREGDAEGGGDNAFSRAIQAHLERRNFAEVERLLTNAARQINESEVRNIRDYLNMMQNRYVMPLLDPNSPNFEAENLFSELITGKVVSLVGPGCPSGYYGDEIDAADTVVRIKYVGREHLPPREFHGHRCDISQYNLLDPLISLADSGRQQSFIEDLKLLVVLIVSKRKHIQGRPILDLTSSAPIYRTTSTSGVRSIFQLSRSSPRQIKIFGYDFYTKIEQYAPEMVSFYQKYGIILGDPFLFNQTEGVLNSRIALSFLSHDPVSNFCFAKNLYQAGMFEIEPFGASILTLTPYQYVERLEEMLGDW